MLSENQAPFREVMSMFVRRRWVLVWFPVSCNLSSDDGVSLLPVSA